MIDTPASFPYPGSWALFEGQAVTAAVRILSTERDDGAISVSVAGKLGASAVQSVPRSMLQDATPLTPAERQELIALESELTGYSGRGNAKSRRAEALRDRAIRARLLKEELARIPAKIFPAVAAARRLWDLAA